MSQIKIIDIMDDETISEEIRDAIWDFVERGLVSENSILVIKAPKNNDVNGSQHHSVTINFGYNDATINAIRGATTLGDYDYFMERGSGSYYDYEEGKYTGNQYEGTGSFYSGVCINPPAYAATSKIVAY